MLITQNTRKSYGTECDKLHPTVPLERVSNGLMSSVEICAGCGLRDVLGPIDSRNFQIYLRN